MILIFIGRIAQSILGLVITRVTTTLLSPDDIGRMALVISITSFFTLLLVSPVAHFLNRRLHTWHDEGTVRRNVTMYLKYLALLSLLVGVAGVLIHRAIGSTLGINAALLALLICGSFLCNSTNQSITASLNMLGFNGWYVFLMVSTVSVGLLTSLLLVLFFGNRMEWWLVGPILAQAAFSFVGITVLFWRVRAVVESDTRDVRRAWTSVGPVVAFCLPLSFSIGLRWMQAQSYRFFIEHTSGLALLGLFVAGYGISLSIMAAFEDVMNAYLMPTFYQRVGEDDIVQRSAAWNAYASAAIPSLILTTAFVAALAPELTRLFLGPQFQSVGRFVVWGAFAEAVRVIAGIYSMVAHAQMRTRLLVLPNAVGALLALAGVATLVPMMGTTGAAVALTLSGVGVVIAMHVLMRAQLVIAFPVQTILSSIAIGLSVFAVIAAGRFALTHMTNGLTTLALLPLAGMIYLTLQYSLLRPTLQVEQAKVTSA